MLLPLEHYQTDKVEQVQTCNTGNCRNGYSVPVIKRWGTNCAYCGKDLAESYDSWLHTSVDHVVPVCAIAKWGEEHRRRIGSLANQVPCCMACNGFLNGYRVDEPAPQDDEQFLIIRNRVLAEKRERALDRHNRERAAFDRWLEKIR